MTEGDEEDLWLQCLAHAKEMYGYYEEQQPPPEKFIEPCMALADRLYKRIKEATTAYKKDFPKHRPVIQMK